MVILILTVLAIKFNHQNFNKIKQIHPIPRFLDLHLTISDGFVSSNIYDECDDFDFDIVILPVLDGDIPRATSYGVCIYLLIRFAGVSSHVADFNTGNKILTAKLLK